MKSPTEYVARALGVLERRFVPWHTIWWNAYTPDIPRGDRYQDGYFDGYGEDDDDDSDDDDDNSRKTISCAVIWSSGLPYMVGMLVYR